MTRIAAIDPGLSGAVAVIGPDDKLDVIDMPTIGFKTKRIVNGIALAEFLQETLAESVVLEQAQAFPKQGVASAFRYGVSFGQVIGVIQALRLPSTHIHPSKWKRDMKLSAEKEDSRRRAIETFPRYAEHFQLKCDHNKAEAALLAQWYRTMNR